MMVRRSVRLQFARFQIDKIADLQSEVQELKSQVGQIFL